MPRRILFYSLFFLSYLIYSVYSFSQVERSLVFWKNVHYWSFQQLMWHLGGSYRTWMMLIFWLILICVFGLYAVAVKKFKSGKWAIKELIVIFVLAFIALLPSFPGLSYDVFNYLMNGKIVVLYNENPAQMAAWDFTGDPWLSFLHNIESPSPYGPVFTVIEAIIYWGSLGYLKLGVWWFRLASVLATIGIAWSIYFLSRKEKVYRTALFLLNPLILIEALSSMHNDILMMAMFMLGVVFYQYLTQRKHRLAGYLTLGSFWLLSVYTKMVTILGLLVYPIYWIVNRRKKIIDYWGLLTLAFIFIMFFDGSKRFFSWYLIWPLSVMPLTNHRVIRKLVILFSISGMLSYSVFLYLGRYTIESYHMRVMIFFSLPLLYLIYLGLKSSFEIVRSKRGQA